MSSKLPKYGHHKATGQARVWVNGKHLYLGRYGSKESKERYARIIAELQSGQAPPPADGLSVVELVQTFWQSAKVRYVKNGKPTSEQASFKRALRPVLKLYGRISAADFGPAALVACRSELIRDGICRTRINEHVYRIRRVWKAGVARQLVPVATWQALCAVEGLRYGEARETSPVKPVKLEHVEAVEKLVSRQVWAMIQLQLLTAARPGEICIMRSCDITTSGPVWEYRPESHKTQHHGHSRTIYLGPKAQEVIKPWLRTELEAPLFSPAEAREAWLNSVRKRLPRKPSRRKPIKQAGNAYSNSSYGRAIADACERAGVPRWSPNRLRHSAATLLRQRYGLEAAQVILGHARANVTEIYAERDAALARRVAGEIG